MMGLTANLIASPELAGIKRLVSTAIQFDMQDALIIKDLDLQFRNLNCYDRESSDLSHAQVIATQARSNFLKPLLLRVDRANSSELVVILQEIIDRNLEKVEIMQRGAQFQDKFLKSVHTSNENDGI